MGYEAVESEESADEAAVVVLGIVAAPGQAVGLARKLLAEDLEGHVQATFPGARWNIEIIEAGVVTPPAGDTQIVDATRDVLLEHEWDLVVCMTDLPLHVGKRPVVAHANAVHGVAVVSVPALGPTGMRQRARGIVTGLIGQLLGADADDLRNHQRAPGRSVLHHRVRQLGTDVNDDGTAFTARVLTGNLRLLTGMVRANRPWRLALGLSRALTGAIAAGVFALVTADIWLLADTFGWIRLTGVAVGSIVAITATLIVGANLWERGTSRQNREQVALFNIVTVITVVLGVGAFYAALFVLASVGVACLVVPQVFSATLGHPAGITDYLEVAWLTCSLATVGGALGAGLETDEAVRDAAYTQHPATPI
ncbi:hypothetical protein IA539_21110 [Gordonia sp. zg691]|uniref:5,10-methylene-tetrahydrofolate dehydrogenase n=1 Tax=Gordonia jinghuaiqii TaxID=2758710 RepID=A0A7D7QID9_9ACTN|nr:hypothetical protein [Gordonia jinghuaiqii]MBD0863678.1 hypothetical protein [Gordonia jinghuaiqii]MCR5979411.1 hypothetical protein [Gordonia jinghuaiqii]QMT04042.1 hypothetical protein H1R19_20435 [Gordonia jinghuaiqii]